MERIKRENIEEFLLNNAIEEYNEEDMIVIEMFEYITNYDDVSVRILNKMSLEMIERLNAIVDMDEDEKIKIKDLFWADSAQEMLTGIDSEITPDISDLF